MRDLYRLSRGRREFLGGLAQYQGTVAGLVARGLEPSKVPEAFPKPKPPKPKIDPIENAMRMRAFTESMHKRR